MNPLPRFLGMALFVVLAILTAIVTASVWRRASVSPGAPATAQHAPAGPSTAPQLAAVSQRVVLGLGATGLVLSAALLFSLAVRRTGAGDTTPPFPSARQEVATLARLAESTAAQGAELSREREVRRRAEEDAHLKQQLLAQSVDEKIRLGRDLHDGIIQSLYAVGLTLESMRPLLQSDPAAAERRLDEVRASLNSAIRDVRGYITGLAPENLRRADFSRGIALVFEQLRAGRDAQLDLNVDEEAAARLSADQILEALQIAREAISNALRHGGATRITLRMHQGEREVGLLVQDNGRGFNSVQTRDGGHGLGNMRARAEALGASLRVTSEPGQGARVVATFPTAQPAQS